MGCGADVSGFSSYFGGVGELRRASLQPLATSYCMKENGGSVKKTFVVTRNILGVAGLLLAGYVLVTSLPDLGRYVKISRM